jgi:hypothetical protein
MILPLFIKASFLTPHPLPVPCQAAIGLEGKKKDEGIYSIPRNAKFPADFSQGFKLIDPVFLHCNPIQ